MIVVVPTHTRTHKQAVNRTVVVAGTTHPPRRDVIPETEVHTRLTVVATTIYRRSPARYYGTESGPVTNIADGYCLAGIGCEVSNVGGR